MLPDKTRIALFVPTLDGGGAERIMVILANYFVRSGYTVDLILVRAQGPYLSLIRDDVNVIDLQTSGVVTAIPKLVAYLRRERPLAMLSTLDHANLAALIAAKIARARTRSVIRLPTTLSIASDHASGLNNKMKFWLLKWLYPLADHIIGISRGCAEDAIKFATLPPDRVTFIYNPIDIDKVFGQLEEAYDIPQVPVILSVSRLGPEKNLETLIRAFSIIYTQRPAHLIMLGEGSQRQALTDLAATLGLENAVSMPGFVDNPYAYMAKADVFVLSSIREGFGNVLIEALACGCPIVSTDCPSGPAEILNGGEFGKLVPVGDVEAMAAAINAVLDDPPDPEYLRGRAADFSIEKIGEQYLEVLRGG